MTYLPRTHRLADLTWPEIDELRPHAPVAIVPLGATEQHGHGMAQRVDTARAEAVADVAIEIIGNHDEEGESDPRFAALGLTGDLDAAEAEAFAAAGSSDEEVPEVGEDALAARLAGLGSAKGKGNVEGATSTQVIVVGLVSVASIASFKRHLGRVAGVNSVGVSSGPDGEFVFAVAHGPEVVLRDVIPSLPSFQARVTSASDGVVHVTAHDPESDG